MKNFGFTMAEVLITIGIIGVVAAITIPLLMQNSNSKKFTTQFKKSLSTLIPKMQYWITKMRTGQDGFPGTEEYRQG